MKFSAGLGLFCLCFGLISGLTQPDGPLVHTENGAVIGTYRLSAKGNQFSSFEGVPYARPPVGKYRFREPQPLKPWMGVWNASSPGSDCLQYDHFTYLAENPFLGDEDCLYLNVYTPKVPSVSSQELLDVIIYIHGGCFTYGAGKWYQPDYLMDRNVVYVSINYRLGPFGFLSTADEIVPGNNGLKDQVAALKWVQRNIAKFGGNPGNVMLTGMSAGGASVHYHYLSPLSAGLFHKGHSMSGSVLLPWTQAEELRKKTEDLASLLGCPVYTSKEIIDCLRHRPAKKIVELVKTYFMPWHFNPYTPFGPTVEVAGVAPFLDQNPQEAMEQGNIKDLPWIASVTSEEGLYPVSNFVANATLLAELENNWDFIAPLLLDYDLTVDSQLKNKVSQKIKEHYMKGKPISPQTTLEFTHMVGDRLFVEGVEAAAKLQAKAVTSPVYFYRFSYRGKHSLSELMSFGSLENFGVSHGDDTGYVIKVPYMNPLATEHDVIMNARMLDLWTSFAKTGVPSFGQDVAWSPMTQSDDQLQYLQVDGPNTMNMKIASTTGHADFWHSLPINTLNRVKNPWLVALANIFAVKCEH
uniref:Carboxylic ester hydrolase n=1 Tax=Cacopsylla melanoneura TaxID=428564 RepID=A0A8D8TZM9_9HEMI